MPNRYEISAMFFFINFTHFLYPHPQSQSCSVVVELDGCVIIQNNIDIKGKGFQSVFQKKNKLEHKRKKCQIFEPNKVVQSKIL